MSAPAPLAFRLATLSDVPAIVALVERAFRGDASRAGWTTEADLLDGQRTDADEVRTRVAAPGARLILAHDATGALVGSVLVADEHGAAYIGMFAVEPARQAGGVGRALLAEAERVARQELGRSTARMTVIRQRPELIAWYERRGYRLTGEREPFPYGDARKGAPRRADLEFLVLAKTL